MDKIKWSLTVLSLLITGLNTLVVSADHSLGKYHWDISTLDSETDPLDLGDNTLTLAWNESLDKASGDWNYSVLKNEVEIGLSNTNCDPTLGRIEICNGDYGLNGWLGIASVWATRGKSNHITQGTVRLNDAYFNPNFGDGFYGTQAWKDFVMCQEVGHTFGLDHQDENFSNVNLGTCMDYTDDPDGTSNGELDNRHPNQHDYEELDAIYAHLNDTSDDTGGGKGNGNGNGNGRKPQQANHHDNKSPNNPSEWGQAVRQDARGRNSVFERILGNGQILVTHVLWAI